MSTEEPVQEDLYPIGTIAEIKQLVKLPKNIVRVLVEGIERAQLVSLEENPNYLEAQIAVFEPEEDLDETVKEAMLRSIKELFVRYCNSNKQVSKELAGQISGRQGRKSEQQSSSGYLFFEWCSRQQLCHLEYLDRSADDK